jgi:uncharacterized membrane protein YhaH (DUF805 family)
MTFTESIKTGLAKLSEFSGRASRSEYWWYSLFLVLALALLVGAIVLASSLTGARISYGAMVVLLVPLYMALMAAQVRRLRDAGFGPLWALANLIPYVGVPLVLALTLRPSRPEGSDTTGPGSLSTLSLLMVTGWGALSGSGSLTREKKPKPRKWLPLIGVALLAIAIFVLVYVYYKDRHDKLRQAPASAPAATAPQGGPSLILMDEASGARLYYDQSTARLAGPGTISIQLVFDFAGAKEREGVSFRSMKQNEVFNCAARGSSWTTRFYMSEPMGEGMPVLIEDGKGSLLDMSDSDTGNQRLNAVCGLLPSLEAPKPASAGGN